VSVSYCTPSPLTPQKPQNGLEITPGGCAHRFWFPKHGLFDRTNNLCSTLLEQILLRQELLGAGIEVIPRPYVPLWAGGGRSGQLRLKAMVSMRSDAKGEQEHLSHD
jgi:hypothetical protein